MFEVLAMAFCGLLLPSGFNIAAANQDNVEVKKTVEFNIAIIKGDPFAERKAGKIKVLANPLLKAAYCETVEFLVGGETFRAPRALQTEFNPSIHIEFRHFAYHMKVTPQPRLDGRILVIVVMETSKPVDITGPKDEVVSFESRSITTRKLMKSGETLKMMCGQEGPGEYLWIELEVREANAERK